MRLVRVARSSEATYGALSWGGVAFAVTLELPWRGNAPRASCIPHGTYQCARVKSPRFGDTFEVKGVHGRSHILFHAGNLWTDTEGCILVGEQFEPVGGKPGIVASRKGFEEFMRLNKDTLEFQLEIIEAT